MKNVKSLELMRGKQSIFVRQRGQSESGGVAKSHAT